MGTPWSPLRYEQWYSRHPKVERRESKRLAQARYRVRHAKRLAAARRVANILVRQSPDVHDLAAALRATLAPADLALLRKTLR
jgi:hypothetical protein